MCFLAKYSMSLSIFSLKQSFGYTTHMYMLCWNHEDSIVKLSSKRWCKPFAQLYVIQTINIAMVYMGLIGLERTDDFQELTDQDWIELNFCGSGLNSGWKILQFAHLCSMASTSVEDDPLSGSHSDRILEFRTGTGSDWILKKLNRIRYGYSNCIAEVVPQPESTPARFCIFLKVYLMSSEISDLCKISDLLLFFCYFVSQNKEIQSGNCFFDVCCVN